MTLIFLAVFYLAVIASLAVGLDGNTTANVWALLAGTALGLFFVHPWRSARKYMYLLCASALAFVVLVVLHNLFDAAAGAMESLWVLPAVLEVLSVAAFLAAIYVCPLAFVIGLVGGLTMLFIGRKGSHSEPPAQAVHAFDRVIELLDDVRASARAEEK